MQSEIVRELLTRIGFVVDTSGAKHAETAATNVKKHLNSISGKHAEKAVDELKEKLEGLATKVNLGPLTEQFSAFRGVIPKLLTGWTGAAVAAIGAGAAIYGLGEKTSRHAMAMYRGAQVAGMAVEPYQELAFAAKESGVEQEALQHTMAKLSRSMGEAHKGSKQAAGAFAALGVKTTDEQGNLRPLNDVMADIADRTKDMGNSADKAGKLQGVLGRGAYQMIPWLAKGSEVMREAAKEAHELGIILDEETIKRSREFTKSKKLIAATAEGIELQLGSMLLPDLGAAMKGAAEWLRENRDLVRSVLKGGIDDAVAIWKLLGATIVGIGEAIKSIRETLQGLTGDVQSGGLKAAFEGLLHPVKAIWQTLQDVAYFLSGRGSKLGFELATDKDKYLREVVYGGKRANYGHLIAGNVVTEGEKGFTDNAGDIAGRELNNAIKTNTGVDMSSGWFKVRSGWKALKNVFTGNWEDAESKALYDEGLRRRAEASGMKGTSAPLEDLAIRPFTTETIRVPLNNPPRQQTVTNSVTVNVSSSGPVDAHEVAGAVSGALQSEWRQAGEQLMSGG